MKVNRLSNTSTEVNLSDGTSILVSYETPVAIYSPQESCFLRTDTFWSHTTSKHINAWLDGATASKISQEDLDKKFNSI